MQYTTIQIELAKPGYKLEITEHELILTIPREIAILKWKEDNERQKDETIKELRNSIKELRNRLSGMYATTL